MSKRVRINPDLPASYKYRPARLYISEPRQGCACSMLTDAADWNDARWDLQPAVLPDLAQAIVFVHENAGTIGFEALWIGEQAAQEHELSLDQLLTLIRNNQIGTAARYWVFGSA